VSVCAAGGAGVVVAASDVLHFGAAPVDALAVITCVGAGATSKRQQS
jgi:hypothetical protein